MTLRPLVRSRDFQLPRITHRPKWWRRWPRHLWAGFRRLSINAWFIGIVGGLIVAALVGALGLLA